MSVRIVDSVQEVPLQTWEKLSPATDPLWTRGLFAAMEEGALGPDRYDYLLVETADQIVAILPTFWYRQLDLGDVLGVEGRRLLRPLQRIAPRACRIRALFSGNLLGEGRVLAEPALAGAVLDVLAEALISLARSRRTRWIICKDLPDDQLVQLGPALRDRGFFDVSALPDAVLPLTWSSFEDYVAGLRAKPRRNTRHKMRQLARHPDLRMETLADFDQVTRGMVSLYQNVLDRAESRLDVWTEEFMHALSRAEGVTTSVVACWQGETLVGFLLCLYGRQNGVALRVGLDYTVSSQAALYHNLHYAGIADALARGCSELGFSQTAYEPKMEMGCHLVPLTHLVTHTNPLLRAILRRALPPALSSATAVQPKEHPQAVPAG